MALLDRIKEVMPWNQPSNAGNSLQGMVGVGAAANYTDYNYKAIIPQFLYKPPFGYPLSKNVPEIRRLARSPYVSMIVNTATAEVSGQDWEIKARDGEDIPEEVLKQTEEFFYNPNRNEESLKHILDVLIRDILEIDAGVLVKVRDLEGNLKEIYARDGGLFNKNPDIYGVLPSVKSGIPAYYQYGWLTGARPIPFLRDEVVYIMQHARSDSIYGLSNVEVLEDTIQLLVYGVDSNLEYFNDNNIPKGIFSMQGADAESVKAFQEAWQEATRKKGFDGKWRRHFHKMPIINSEGKFERIGFSNIELELLQQQDWFSKLVWACFGINPDELGYTDNSNKAVANVQSTIFKRKLLKPLINLLEYHFNTEVVNDLPWIKGKYEDKVLFEFNKYDMQEDLAKMNLFQTQINMGLKTVNEIREELHLEPIVGGDTPKGVMNFGGFPNSRDLNNEFIAGNNASSVVSEEGPKVVNESDVEEGVKKVGVKALMSSAPLTLKEFEFMASKDIKGIERVILDLTRKEMRNLVKLKALNNDFVKAILGAISFDGMKSSVGGFIKKSFFNGLVKAENNTKGLTGKNVVPNYNAMDFLSTYTFDNVKGMEDDTKNKLREVLQRGIINGSKYGDVAKDIRSVFDATEVRAKAIARTESHRASVEGELQGYKSLGLKGTKTYVATLDSKTSPICRALNGTVVSINGKFKYKGEEFDAPPAHPNCRSVLNYDLG